MNIALVYDRVNKFGGAERILMVLHEIWPEAPLYTSVYDPKATPWTKGWDVRTSFLQKFPWARRNHEPLGWLMPLAFESLDLSGFDVVISVTSEAAKGVVTSPRQLHICYLLTPTRYLWSHARDYLDDVPRATRPLVFLAQAKLREWDYLAAQRPDHIIAVSEHVRRRCEKYYRREAEVLYPPLQLLESSSSLSRVRRQPLAPLGVALRRQQSRALRPTTSASKDYFLVVSRLVRYKKVDIAIEACNRLREPLLVIGSGREKKRLEWQAGPTVKFIENVSDEELVEYYRNARAVLMPQEEDLGLVALEAQSCGTPVISYRHSGAAEVIVDGKTGRLFDRQDVSSLIRAMKDCPEDPAACTIYASRFSKKKFQKDFRDMIESFWRDHSGMRP